MRSLLPRALDRPRLILVFPLLGFGLSVSATPLNDVQSAAAEWARIRSETSHLESEWATERQLLDASIASLEIEADQLELEHKASVAESSKERDEIAALTEQNQLNAARISETLDRINQLSTELIAMRPALPPRLSTALELPFLSITDPELGPADRMRHTMMILNRCQQFDQTFVLTEEILSVTPDSEPRLLEVVYWGLAQGCALDRAAGEAYIGRPVDGVWLWQPAPDSSDLAARLIDVRRDTAPPEFIPLPFQITGGDQ